MYQPGTALGTPIEFTPNAEPATRALKRRHLCIPLARITALAEPASREAKYLAVRADLHFVGSQDIHRIRYGLLLNQLEGYFPGVVLADNTYHRRRFLS